MRTLIKNGTIATAADLYKADVLIEDERISFNDVPITIAKREFGY